MNNPFLTTEELAADAREALRNRPKLTGREYFVQMIRNGFINEYGEVTRIIGGEAEPTHNYKNYTLERLDARKLRKKKVSKTD